jgi:hypothetical protein
MARLTLTAAAFALTTAVSTLGPVATVAQANETGMASIHSWRKVGKKTCLVDHDHAGNGSGTNRQQAELAAIRAWTGFTDLEYGAAWANFNKCVVALALVVSSAIWSRPPAGPGKSSLARCRQKPATRGFLFDSIDHACTAFKACVQIVRALTAL